MCAMCGGQSVEDYVRTVEGLIERHGWALQYVDSRAMQESVDLDDGEIVPAYCYTVGLTGHGRAEIVLTGRSPEESASVLNVLARRALFGGDALEPGAECVAAGFELSFVEVTYGAEWMPMVERLYPDRESRAVQAVWRDMDGLLPWEGYYPSTLVQPVLGAPPGWYDDHGIYEHGIYEHGTDEHE